MAVSVDTLPWNCEVMGFLDEACRGALVPLRSTGAVCLTPITAVKTFKSVLVECEPLDDD